MDQSSFNEIFTCTVCFEVYNEGGRNPRILTCGHTFCHLCLEKILVENPSCPSCKVGIQAGKAELIPVNYLAKNVLSLSKKSNSQINGANFLPVHIESDEFCSEHSNFKEFRCMDCDSSICSVCGMLLHKQCRTLLVKEAFKELKVRIEKELKTKESLHDKIIQPLKTLEEERTRLLEEIKNKEIELTENEKKIAEHQSHINDHRKLCDNLNDLGTSVDSSSCNEEYSKIKVKLEEFIVEEVMRFSQLYSSLPSSGPSKPTVCSIEKLRILSRRRFVYVIEENDDGDLVYGEVKMNEGNIWITSFCSQLPDTPYQILLIDAFRFPYKVFLKLAIDFLDNQDDSDDPEYAEWEEVNLVIETEVTSARARSFILSCLALKGQSHIQKRFKCPNSAFYKSPTRIPPAATDLFSDEELVPCREGYVTEGFNYCLYIQLKDNLQHSNIKIGTVVSGLEKLKVFGNDRLKLFVKDCGVIL